MAAGWWIRPRQLSAGAGAMARIGVWSVAGNATVATAVASRDRASTIASLMEYPGQRDVVSGREEGQGGWTARSRALTCLLALVAELGVCAVAKGGARVKEGCGAGPLACGGVVWC